MSKKPPKGVWELVCGGAYHWSQHSGGRYRWYLWVQGQPDLHTEFQTSQGYTGRPYLQKRKNRPLGKFIMFDIIMLHFQSLHSKIHLVKSGICIGPNKRIRRRLTSEFLLFPSLSLTNSTSNLIIFLLNKKNVCSHHRMAHRYLCI